MVKETATSEVVIISIGVWYLSNTSNQTAENLYKKILVAKNQLINDRILSKKNDNHQDPIKEIKFKITYIQQSPS